jgi:hypothetical protein
MKILNLFKLLVFGVLFLLSLSATVFFGAETFDMLVRIARTGSVFTGSKADVLQDFSPILAILLFRASLHLGRRLTGQ